MELADFSQQLGSDQPAPGGGAAAGYILSLAAAAAQKAMVFSKPENYEKIHDFLEMVRKDGLYLCDEDQRTFLEWQNARKLPKDTDEQKAIRTAEVNRTAAECASVPVTTGTAAKALIVTLKDLLPVCKKFLISDISCAASFALAALQAARVNVEINLPYVKDEKMLEKIDGFLMNFDEIKEQADKLIEDCRKAITD
jgi:glutamate formiminotransferase/formiminotetrahydrofolate cyclodeaminase